MREGRKTSKKANERDHMSEALGMKFYWHHKPCEIYISWNESLWATNIREAISNLNRLDLALNYTVLKNNEGK